MIYKKCEICGNKVNKLEYLFTFKFNGEIECKKCGLKYKISNIKFCTFLSNIIETFYALFCLFFSIGLGIYIDENFDVHWLVSVLVFVLAWFFSSLICIFLEWLVLLLFIAKLGVSKDKKGDSNSSIFSNLISKVFSIFIKK